MMHIAVFAHARADLKLQLPQEEALNVYLSGRAALEDGGFGDKFEMPLTCNTLLFWLWATKSGPLKLVTSDCRNVQLPRNHMT